MHGFPLSGLWPRIECSTLVLLSTVGLAGPDEGFISGRGRRADATDTIRE
jgi:hypothetical protein